MSERDLRSTQVPEGEVIGVNPDKVSVEQRGNKELSIDKRLTLLFALVLGMAGCAEPAPEGTISLEVKQNYSGLVEDPVEPIQPAVESILKELDYVVVTPQDPAHDRLEIRLNGRGIIVTYTDKHNGFNRDSCYTKAEYYGSVSLNGQSYDVENTHIPFIAFTCPKDPEGAPFEYTWPKAVMEGLVRHWGVEAVEAALKNTNCNVIDAAADTFGESISKKESHQAVPSLIAALKESVEKGCSDYEIVQALRRITEKSDCYKYSSDQECFQSWWDEQE